ncbi:MAG: pseudaminic acid biosynthesis-associated methylase [Planctomycetaceae bacterium]|nr:MAG: pseudaminic acid biosynthesis-associated methylase [Planctomycetaceae bacterium]
MVHGTEQEAFWEGSFGNEYTDRNRGPRLVAANTALFSHVLCRTRNVHRVLELGSNIGLNLMALRQLLPGARLSAVEINDKAACELTANLPDVDLHRASILEFQPRATWDLVFTKGVLIHIDPGKLPLVYDLMYCSSSRYVLVCEYYNRKPTEVTYRGHTGKLFKRDFAGDMLDRFPDLSLLDYGFVYHRDPNFPQDDMTWFLMEKKGMLMNMEEE